jgi:aspartyl-tRNA(Asn)/glutamyl-tRNA(Gln) amidotransferase subunit A
MTRSVADCALIFEIMAGRPVGSALGKSPDGARIRIVKPTNYFFEEVEADDLAAVERAISLFKSAGVTVIETRIADVEHSPAAHFITVAAEATEMFWKLLIQRGHLLGEDLRARLEVGQFILAADYIKSQRFRHHLREMFLQSLSEGDVLVTPTIQVLPPKIDESSVSVAARASSLLGRFTGPLNVTGLPGITIPCGMTSDGAPVGLQLIGRADDEASVFRAAYVCEAILAQSFAD